jgi:hypothetical protein
MSTISLNLPESLYHTARKLAEKENIPVDQLFTLAIEEKVSALMAEEALGERASRGDAERFRRAMAKVARTEPAEDDRL